jgi:ABC-type Fe3+/spermidine/putrescine transport system ATPase subunit
MPAASLTAGEPGLFPAGDNPGSPTRRYTVRVREVTKTFGSFTALDRVSLDVPEGAMLAILGPSGCGKTTMMRIIAGLEEPTAGAVEINGRDVTDVPPYRRNVGLVFQNYGLFPHKTVAANVAYGLKRRRLPRAEVARRSDEALAMVQLTEFRQRRPGQLSGGQRQRVALARAIAINPDVLLLDEPLSALDARLRHQVREEIIQLQRRLRLTTVMVTHDQDEALSMAELVVVMNQGRIEQVGPPTEIYQHPASTFVANFVGACNLLDAAVLAVEGQLARVSILGKTVEVPAGNVAGRSHVKALSRPEALQVTPWPPAAERAAVEQPDAGAVRGVVRSTSYFGATSQYQIELATGETVRAASVNQGQAPFAVGDEVAVSWGSRAWTVVPPDPRGAE